MIAQKSLESGKARLAALWAALAMLMTGCATQPTIIDIIKDVNAEFKTEYEAILAKDGTRVFKVTRSEAYDAIRVSMARLRMTVESQDPVLGYVNVFADAPLPLSADEWSEAARADLPKLQEICRRRAFIECFLIRFEPEGLQSTITGTVFEVKGGTAVSFTARMREVAPPKSGFPRREYLPPTAVRVALAKIWSEIEREFKATVRRP
jgi:hypothetical protein